MAHWMTENCWNAIGVNEAGYEFQLHAFKMNFLMQMAHVLMGGGIETAICSSTNTESYHLM